MPRIPRIKKSEFSFVEERECAWRTRLRWRRRQRARRQLRSVQREFRVRPSRRRTGTAVAQRPTAQMQMWSYFPRLSAASSRASRKKRTCCSASAAMLDRTERVLKMFSFSACAGLRNGSSGSTRLRTKASQEAVSL